MANAEVTVVDEAPRFDGRGGAGVKLTAGLTMGVTAGAVWTASTLSFFLALQICSNS